MKDTNKNFIYNVIYQVFIFIIPFVTTPYISRVLGVENVGIYSYTYSGLIFLYTNHSYNCFILNETDFIE